MPATLTEPDVGLRSPVIILSVVDLPAPPDCPWGILSNFIAEKAETANGWLFPVGDELVELGYVDMFSDMFNAMDEGRAPVETFYDGYVVNAVMDACYASVKSKRWEPVTLREWRGGTAGTEPIGKAAQSYEGHVVIKQEKMPDGRMKMILKDPLTGAFTDVFV